MRQETDDPMIGWPFVKGCSLFLGLRAWGARLLRLLGPGEGCVIREKRVVQSRSTATGTEEMGGGGL